LGIDPGSRFTGWGVVRVDGRGELRCLGQGVFALSEREPLALRLCTLAGALEDLVRKFEPSVFSVERVFLGKNVDSAFKLGHARGVVLAVAGRFGAVVHEYATRSAKKMITGNGGAAKEQVQFVVQSLLGIREPSLDATDALALAICHAREMDVRAKFAELGARTN